MASRTTLHCPWQKQILGWKSLRLLRRVFWVMQGEMDGEVGGSNEISSGHWRTRLGSPDTSYPHVPESLLSSGRAPWMNPSHFQNILDITLTSSGAFKCEMKSWRWADHSGGDNGLLSRYQFLLAASWGLYCKWGLCLRREQQCG